MEPKKPIDPQKATRNLKEYARYSNLGIQMIVVILLGVFGGIQLDKWLHTEVSRFYSGVVLYRCCTGNLYRPEGFHTHQKKVIHGTRT